MPVYRDHLPQLDAALFLTDGGIETTMIFDEGIDLPDFAAFTLLAEGRGRDALQRYFDAYAAIAVRDQVGIVLETPTWRASSDWGARRGYDLEQLDAANRAGVALLEDTRRRHARPGTPIVISGCVGPRGDGYQPGATMTVAEARAYHAGQVRTFAASEADLVTAITMTYVDEAIGIATAARAEGVPVVIAFTVETDGALPTGQSLAGAIAAVDTATDAYPAYYMVNCAHPKHFGHVLEAGSAWAGRLRGIRANASELSHAELDEATELDSGDPHALAELYRGLRQAHPQITVVGGCCGTDHRHVGAISATCLLDADAVR
ncbi:MAG: homocysteine S-methyltransferase [Acidimicrobiia bacterium]|nr:homocysteine S-methyltransferase [Acidimicrobiia bacterium]